MEPNAFPHLQLWCPRPFGTYTQNKPCPAPAGAATGPAASTARKAFSCHPAGEVPVDASVPSENTPPAPAPTPPPPPPPPPAQGGGDASPVPAAAPAEEGRVLLDTWYVIKPGNTKEKVAFFVAHQCGAGAGAAGTGPGPGTPGRATTMKVKGHWGNDSSKAKRRRRCHHPARGQPCPGWAKDLAEHQPPPGDATPDLLSVAEMVALVEQRTALALQSFPRPCGGPGAPVVIVETAEGGAGQAPPAAAAAAAGMGGTDCKRVAEAVAHFESRQRDLGTPGPNALCHPGGAGAAPVPPASPGEVRIAFRISSTRDARGGAHPAEPGPGGAGGGAAGAHPGCAFTNRGGGGAGAPRGAKDKITCDLYQLISPSRDALPSNVEFLLAAAGPEAEPGQGDGAQGDGAGEGGGGGPGGEAVPGSAAGRECPAGRDCSSGFHVDVVVTGVVDQCVFYGKDSAKQMKEETVKLPPPPLPPPPPPPSHLLLLQEDLLAAAAAAAAPPPPPGQLFLLPGSEEAASGEEGGEGAGEEGGGGGGGAGGGGGGGAGLGGGGGGAGVAGGDPALCRLYRHVSHDFLEIRFKIQRLLEPRQYMLLLPEHVMLKIFSYLPTAALAALKCSCHYFKSLIETFGVQATDSRWNRDPLYRDDPCKQCKKHYQKGDVSLCRWHPKPYHHDLPYGRSYWMCCRRPDKEAPGCRVGLHDNNWVPPAPRREDGR